MQTNLKICRGCGQVKDITSDFAVDRSKKGGITSRCKECCRQSSSRRRSLRSPEQKEADAFRRSEKRRAANPEARQKINCQARLRYGANRADQLRRNALYRKRALEKIKLREKVRRTACADLLREQYASYYLRNREQILARNKIWRLDNRERRACSLARRRAAVLQRIPRWLSAEAISQIKEVYARARQMSEASFLSYHVDHIYPLQGRYVSGLHVPENLQILLASENLKKSNKWTPQ